MVIAWVFMVSYLFTSCSHPNRNFVAALNVFLDAELQSFVQSSFVAPALIAGRPHGCDV